MTTDHTNHQQEQEQESKINLRLLWSILLVKRYWFIVSFLLFLAGAVVYLKLQTTTYLMTSKVLIKDQDEGSSSISHKLNFMENMGFANNSNGFDNELEVLSSDNLSEIVVRHLKLYTQYYYKGRFRFKEFYGNFSPWIVDIDSATIDTLQRPLTLILQQQEDGVISAELTYDGEQKTTFIKSLPATIPFSPTGNLHIHFQDSLFEADTFDFHQKIKVTVMPLSLATIRFGSRLEVAPTSKTTTVALLQYVDNLPERGVDYLKELTQAYNIDATSDYNQEAQQTADFIRQRLKLISTELDDTENSLEHFKRKGGISDYDNDVKMSATQKYQYDNRIAETETQYRLVSDLLDYVNNPGNKLQPVPSNIGLADPTLAKSLEEYNKIIFQYQQLQRTAAPGSPTLRQAEQSAADFLKGIRMSLNTLQKQYAIRISDLQRQAGKYSHNLNTSPTKEHTLAQIKRQQEVKSGLFIMLLQKREETLIQLASSVYKAKEIEKPACRGYISPRPRWVYLIALALALALPSILFFAIRYFKIRVTTEEELKALTDIPIFGYVPFVKALTTGKRTIVIEENRNSLMMEVYRQLRSTLPFVMKPGDKVLLFTSCVAGEGKTSIACNLGTSIAFTGRRVLLMGLDIRKPRLAGLFNLEDEENGISNYLARNAADTAYLESLIQHTDISPNLDIIAAGTIPPNPGELLTRPNLRIGLEYLKQQYDYIIMDTAPIGLVSDTISLAPLADVTFYIVRSGYTLKADMQLINEYRQQGIFQNINIIFNSVNLAGTGIPAKAYGSKTYGIGRTYGYGYGYGYRYGYGYGNDKLLEEV